MKNLKTVFALLIFVLYGCSASADGSKKIVDNSPADIFGTWEIYRYIEVGGHGPDTTVLLKKSMGTKVEFGKNYLRCSNDSLVAKKGLYEHVGYKWKIRNYNFRNGYLYKDGYDEGTLDFYTETGDEAFETKTVGCNITIDAKNNWADFFELTKKGELAIYGDGYFVFLKRVK